MSDDGTVDFEKARQRVQWRRKDERAWELRQRFRQAMGWKTPPAAPGSGTGPKKPQGGRGPKGGKGRRK